MRTEFSGSRTAQVAGTMVGLWLVLSTIWAVHVLEYGQTTVLGAVRSGALSMGLATLLGVVVWALSPRLMDRGRGPAGVVAVHGALATAYAALWILGGHLISIALGGDGLLRGLLEANVLGWRFLMGVLFYGVTAAMSIAVRTKWRLVDQELRARRAEAQASRSRMRAIRSQLNPHFLFNSLHSLGSLVDRDPEGAKETIERLGDMLRYLLDEQEGQVLLSEEWAFTENYIEIEKIRLGDRVRFHVDVDDRALSRMVPSFLIQSLVENALRHGVRSPPAVTNIRIEVGDDGGVLSVRVADDGRGCAHLPADEGEGLGLRAVRERLKGLYGGHASVRIETAPDRGFVAEIRVDEPSAEADSVISPPEPAAVAGF